MPMKRSLATAAFLAATHQHVSAAKSEEPLVFDPSIYPTTAHMVQLTGDEDVIYTGTIPTQFGTLTDAFLFQISDHALTGTLPTQLGNLEKNQYGIFVNGNSLTGTIPTELGKATLATYAVQLQENQFRGAIPTQFGQLTGLTSGLGLYANSLESTLPTELGNLEALEGNLLVQENRITGTVPTQFGQLTELTHGLGLYSNKIEGTVPTELGAMTKLQEGMYLAYNRMKSTIPTQLGQLTGMTANMVMNFVEFTGTVPTQLGRLTRMTAGLSFNNNALCAELPAEVAALERQLDAWEWESNKLGEPCELSGDAAAAAAAAAAANEEGEEEDSCAQTSQCFEHSCQYWDAKNGKDDAMCDRFGVSLAEYGCDCSGCACNSAVEAAEAQARRVEEAKAARVVEAAAAAEAAAAMQKQLTTAAAAAELPSLDQMDTPPVERDVDQRLLSVGSIDSYGGATAVPTALPTALPTPVPTLFPTNYNFLASRPPGRPLKKGGVSINYDTTLGLGRTGMCVKGGNNNAGRGSSQRSTHGEASLPPCSPDMAYEVVCTSVNSDGSCELSNPMANVDPKFGAVSPNWNDQGYYGDAHPDWGEDYYPIPGEGCCSARFNISIGDECDCDERNICDCKKLENWFDGHSYFGAIERCDGSC